MTMSPSAQEPGSQPADGFVEHPDDSLPERVQAIDHDDAEQRAASLRAGLDQYELEEEDRELLEAYGVIEAEDLSLIHI